MYLTGGVSCGGACPVAGDSCVSLAGYVKSTIIAPQVSTENGALVLLKVSPCSKGSYVDTTGKVFQMGLPSTADEISPSSFFSNQK